MGFRVAPFVAVRRGKKLLVCLPLLVLIATVALWRPLSWASETNEERELIELMRLRDQGLIPETIFQVRASQLLSLAQQSPNPGAAMSKGAVVSEKRTQGEYSGPEAADLHAPSMLAKEVTTAGFNRVAAGTRGPTSSSARQLPPAIELWDGAPPVNASTDWEQTLYLSSIPRRLIFTHEHNLLTTCHGDPPPPQCHSSLLYRNMMKTVEVYRKAWKEKDAPINFYADEDCRRALMLTEPLLVPHFDMEDNGAYKGDMCRVAALVLNGGYYFDVDIVAITPVLPGIKTDFVSCVSSDGRGMFQAFLAATPHHPILRGALSRMLDYFRSESHSNELLGTSTLLKEFDEWAAKEWGCSTSDGLCDCDGCTKCPDDTAAQAGRCAPHTLRSKRGSDGSTNVWLLEETRLVTSLDEKTGSKEGQEFSPPLYPQIQRQVSTQNWKTTLCNFIVHDATLQQPFFYSRLVGTKDCP